MSDHDTVLARIETGLANVNSEDWDRCANPDATSYNPFLSHAFLSALEESGCVAPETGWTPQHIVLQNDGGDVLACMSCYLKGHSQGEYIFDYAWADAYERAGGRYYPKLLSAVPFTPVTGRRFLVPHSDNHDQHENMLLSAALQLCDQYGVSSFHANFVTQREADRLGSTADDGNVNRLLVRTDRQFHWLNDDYENFDGFLASLASRKRKVIRKERRQAVANGIDIEWLTGSAITEGHWDAFFEFYLDTGIRKWGSPYLNRAFFSLLGAALGERCLLVMCKRDGRYIAGALNLVGGDTLYGRYWGCVEHHDSLHFEVCYYQAIDYAIAHGLAVVEAGAQGEHKLARGYLPHTTYSLHHLADPGLADAVARYLTNERDYVSIESEALLASSPFRQSNNGNA